MRKLLREVGIDWTRIGRLTADRKAWKRIVKERMDHLAKWEESKGHSWQGAVMERNVAEED